MVDFERAKGSEPEAAKLPPYCTCRARVSGGEAAALLHTCMVEVVFSARPDAALFGDSIHRID
jgi:hypothetical protein